EAAAVQWQIFYCPFRNKSRNVRGSRADRRGVLIYRNLRSRLSETQSDINVCLLTHGKMDPRSNCFGERRLLDMDFVKAYSEQKKSIPPHIVRNRVAYARCIRILSGDIRPSDNRTRWICNCAEDRPGILSRSSRGE